MNKIVIAWPENRLLIGEELDQLVMDLADYGNQVNVGIADSHSTDGYVTAVPEACEKALECTVRFLGSTGIGDLTETVISCWKRNDTISGTKLSADDGHRRKLLLRSTLLDSADIIGSSHSLESKIQIDISRGVVSLSSKSA